MSNNIFFTSDTHFNHGNILKYNPDRGCTTIEEMNEKIIERWNNVIAPGDTVYHLGDVAFGNPKNAVDLVKRLNGKKHLIKGNHDTSVYLRYIAKYFDSISEYKEIKVESEYIILCHYPIAKWHRQHHGAYHLYGHVHGTPVPELDGTRSMDVGLDTNKTLCPYSWDYIKERLGKIEVPPTCHHGRGK